MTKKMQKLLRELELPGGCPGTDAKAVRRRVNAALNADPGERKAYMKQKIRFAAVLTAAVVALTGAALAAAPALRELLDQALGSFAPYAQEIAGVSAVDQGIEITALSAVADRQITRVYLSAKDLKGDRLSGGNLTIRGYAGREVPEDSGIYASSMGFQYLGYDEASRVALFMLEYSSQAKALPNAPVKIRIEAIKPDIHYIDYDAVLPPPPYRQNLAIKTLPTGETVLATGQTPTELEGESGVKLSSLGFGADGLLHVQFQMPQGALEEYNSIKPYLWKPTGDPKRPRDYYDGAAVQFRENGVLYKDITYEITPKTLKDVVVVDELGGAYRTSPQIDGEWNLSVPLDAMPLRTITISQALSGLQIKTVSLTAITATAETEPVPGEKPRYGVPGLPLTLYFADGTHMAVKDRYEWTFDRAIDPADVTALAIGMWYIPLDGDAALPGRWLTELPQ